eukprot:IDg15923t1
MLGLKDAYQCSPNCVLTYGDQSVPEHISCSAPSLPTNCLRHCAQFVVVLFCAPLPICTSYCEGFAPRTQHPRFHLHPASPGPSHNHRVEPSRLHQLRCTPATESGSRSGGSLLACTCELCAMAVRNAATFVILATVLVAASAGLAPGHLARTYKLAVGRPSACPSVLRFQHKNRHLTVPAWLMIADRARCKGAGGKVLRSDRYMQSTGLRLPSLLRGHGARYFVGVESATR